MPGNKRPGGSHLRRRPRPRDPAAALRTIALNQQTHNRTPLAGDQLLTLALGYHSALNAVQHGAGLEEHAHTLALASNVAIVLCDAGLAMDRTQDVRAGQAAVLSLMLRGDRTRRYVFTGPELMHARELLQIHDQQLQSPDCTEGLMSAALCEIKRRMEAGQVMSDAQDVEALLQASEASRVQGPAC
jgi:hypothetical protein